MFRFLVTGGTINKSCLPTEGVLDFAESHLETMLAQGRFTAGYLLASDLDKTIVLISAMIPYQVTNSDALFNLGSAVTAAQLLEQGVYIAMNGEIFSADNVIKN